MNRPEQFPKTHITLIAGKNVGISRNTDIFPREMIIRSIIALFMGLVIQLSQVQSHLAASPAETCVISGQSACCCGELQSCPCVSESAPAQKPAPLIPAAVDLKQLISKAPEPNSPVVLISPPTNVVRHTAPLIERRSGYAGVPLSVAFCRFTI